MRLIALLLTLEIHIRVARQIVRRHVFVRLVLLLKTFQRRSRLDLAIGMLPPTNAEFFSSLRRAVHGEMKPIFDEFPIGIDGVYSNMYCSISSGRF